jgi:hypothetical protein
MNPILACTGILAIASFFLSQSSTNLDTHFAIALSRTNEPNGIVADITTTSTYPCEGYRIQTRMTREYDTLTVHIGGVVRPTPCLSMFGAASGTAYLGNSLRGTYFLKVRYRASNDLYKLIISDKSIFAVPLHAEFTDI